MRLIDLRTLRDDYVRTSTTSERFSRRDLLRVASFAGIRTAVSDVEIEFRRDDGGFAFFSGNQEWWRVDVRSFAGVPTLKVEEGQDRISILLERARLAGTSVPAGFACELRRAGKDWDMRLAVGAAKGVFRSRLSSWLLGDVAAEFEFTHSAFLIAGRGCRAKTNGAARLVYLPSNAYRIASDDAIALVTDYVSVRGSALELHPVSRAGETSTAARLDGCSLSAPLTFSGEMDSRIEAGHAPMVFIEATEKSLRVRSEQPQALYVPGADLCDEDGVPVRLPLSRLIVSSAHDQTSSECLALATMDSPPVWLHASGASLRLAAG